MKRTLLALGVAVLGLSLAGASYATTQTLARVALQAKANTTKASTVCTTWSPNADGTPCTDYTVDQIPSAQGSTYQVYLVVGLAASGPGLGGLSCGVAYDPTLFVSWTLCADLEFPNGAAQGRQWPLSGGGNRITWNVATNCQRTEVGVSTGGSGNVHAVAGSFYIYCYGGDGMLEVTENLNLMSGDELVVADCASQESDLNPTQQASKVGFGTLNGLNACNTVPAQNTTWGSIKKQFAGE